jgi:hypothetical protein
MRAFILEDNRDRRVAMIGRLAERFPFLHVAFFDSSEKMINCMESDNLQDLAILSLDHDLEMIPGPEGDWIDPGTGLDVARWLSERKKPFCPVIVHTTNTRAGAKMMRLLEKAHWVSHRVVPHDDLGWIDEDWFRLARNAIVGFAPQRRSTPIALVEGKIGLIRSLLNGRYENGQAFCRAATGRIIDAYVRDLRQMLGEDVSAEVISLVSANAIASALEMEGPVARWFRDQGISGGAFSEWAERGPLGAEQLEVGEHAAQRLSQSGVKQIQVRIIEVADMQALLVVSAAKPLALASVQATVTELKQTIEIAVFVGLHWSSTGKKIKPTGDKTRN